MVRLLGYVHGRKRKENIILVKRSYKDCSILVHHPKLQYIQTLKSLNTYEFIKLLILSTLKEGNVSLSMELDTSSRLRACIYRQNFVSKVKQVAINFKPYSSKISNFEFLALNFSFIFFKPSRCCSQF